MEHALVSRIRNEFELFLLALGYLTRAPIPRSVEMEESRLDGAVRYFPWVGLLVGALAAGSFWLFFLLYSHALLALLLSLAVTLLATGAFHEDGFADFCDGFGGGWTREDVLAIMKDSRLGSYGAIGIVVLLIVKVVTLSLMGPATIVMALVLAHGWSRLTAVSLLLDLPYVRDNGKSAAVASRMSVGNLLYGALPPLVLLLWLELWPLIAVLVAVFVTRQGMAIYLRRRIGGVTGDCLGATQQLAEVSIYLALLAVPFVGF